MWAGGVRAAEGIGGSSGIVRMQETLSSQSSIGVDWVKAFQNGVKQF